MSYHGNDLNNFGVLTARVDGLSFFPVQLCIMLIEVIQEELSVAYLQAIAGRVNVCVSRGRDVGVDGTLHKIRPFTDGYFLDQFDLAFQLKSTTAWYCSGTSIKYDLKVPIHNKIVERNNEFREKGGTPCLLILYCMPDNQEEWLDVDDEKLLMRKCCYWQMLTGARTDNDRTIRIEIPENQTLTPESLLELFDMRREGTL